MKRLITKALRIQYGVFLVLLIISSLVSVFALRANNQEMVKLRSAVYAADEQNDDVNKALNDLRTYVYGHMNTDLSSGGNTIKPPIQLKNTYERLKAAEDQKVKEANSKIYTDAQTYCQIAVPNPTTLQQRVPCVENYVTTHGGATAQEIPAALYQFDFVSPAWSPDLAGWSLAFSGLMAMGFLLAFVVQKFSRPPETDS